MKARTVRICFTHKGNAMLKKNMALAVPCVNLNILQRKIPPNVEKKIRIAEETTQHPLNDSTLLEKKKTESTFVCFLYVFCSKIV